MKQSDQQARLSHLRKRAEEKLDSEFKQMTETLPEDIPRLLYDLRTHQIELDMQNEELRMAQHDLVEARDRYIQLYDLAPIGYVTISHKGLILELNQTFVKMLDQVRAQLINQPLSAYIVKPDQDTYYLFVSRIRKTKQQQNCELRINICNRSMTATVSEQAGVEERDWCWVRIESRPLFDENGEVYKINLAVSDISEYKRASEQLKHLATYDQLTGLPNRYLLETELNQRINAARRFHEKIAIVFIDLDHFKVINDTMGHDYGDILLQLVAKRLSCHLRDYDTVSRFGGDEFVLVMPQIHDNNEIVSVVDKIIREFSNVYNLKQQEAFISASIGISIFPDDGTTFGALLKNADAAMYRAKDAGRDRYCFFTQSMNHELRRHQMITSEIRLSLAHEDFSLYYQPLIDSQSGKITSCEALIRWHQINGELISPAEFIPIAEKSELINRIGEWVINQACQQSAEWKAMGLSDMRIDINLSGRQFIQDDVFRVLKHSLQTNHLQPEDIGIELTEHVLIQADEINLSNLRSLDKAGMQISIDDFGTGYSSLSYLKRFPVRNLKIDQEFIRDAPTNAADRSIMEAIVAVGHSLGLKVIVEGVETEQQHRLAQQIGCDLEQGFFFHKPMPASQLYTILAHQNASPN